MDRFFWDTDFLMSPKALDLSPDQRREQLDLSDEAYSIAAGLRAHPSEVEFRPWLPDDPAVEQRENIVEASPIGLSFTAQR